MSETFINPTSPIQRRDIRSASKPFKRDRDHDQKWSNGARPLAGVRVNIAVSPNASRVDGGGDEQERFRPAKSNPLIGKSHATRSPKPVPSSSHNASHPVSISTRVSKKGDSSIESTSPDDLSDSMLALLPTHKNNKNTPVRVAQAPDAEILYSFEKRPSPNAKGREVGLGGLIEQAEKKWERERTEQMMKEYEVLDLEGEAVKGGTKKGGKSPKKAPVHVAATKLEEEDDGFELI